MLGKNTKDRGTELIWQGKYREDGSLNLPEKVSWPFQTIETVNESKADREKKQKDLGFEKKESGPWRNRLIWGDNKYIMSSLLKEFAGKINLIYIDPPFATGADFSYKVEICNEEITKEPSMIEEVAYRDTWGKGMDSYLQMMFERLALMRDLLADNGSIYVHLDWHVGHYLKIVLDEIFGRDYFLNEIIWQKLTTPKAQTLGFGNVHDVILWYSKGEKIMFNEIRVSHQEDYLKKMYRFVEEDTGRRYRLHDFTQKGQGEAKRFGKKLLSPPPGKHWIWSQEKIDSAMENGLIVFSKTGTPQVKRYLEEVRGQRLHDIWTDINPIGSVAMERLDYPTQKPEALLERIIHASSVNNETVADFFCGSGTTGAVAEKLGRRWIMADLSRFAVQTTRKRLLQIENCSPFVVQNLGKYERQYWYSAFGSESAEGKRKEYQETILSFYRAESVTGYQFIHGTKGKSVVSVGELDVPITLDQVDDIIKECIKAKQDRVDILGWEFEMGLDVEVEKRNKTAPVNVRLLRIPKEVMDPKYAGKIEFYDLGALDLETIIKDRNVEIQIKSFYIPHLELVKEEEVRAKIKHWQDYIDYWAIDWNYRDDTFHNEWQEFRTRKNPKLNLRASSKESASGGRYYKEPGEYKIVAKVIDIFGNDTTRLLEVKIK